MWRKSTRSNATGNCLYADTETMPGFVLVRESTQDTMGDDQPVLRVPADSWTAFIAGVKQGEFDLVTA
jgi:hypothetical protein